MGAKDKLFKSVRREKIEVEQLGEVWVREFTLGEVQGFEGKDYAHQVCQVLVEEDGSQALSTEDVEKVRSDVPFRIQKAIVEKAAQMTGLNVKDDEADDAGKNSESPES